MRQLYANPDQAVVVIVEVVDNFFASCVHSYTSKAVLKKHIRVNHVIPSTNNISRRKANVSYCSVCQFSSCSFDILVSHYIDHHEIDIKTENYNFDNYDNFLTWKEDEEKRCKNRYVKKYGARATIKGCKRIIYYCHRSGFYKSKNTGKRHLKVQGSRKIGKYCPSRIFLKIKENGEVSVKYIVSHVGHNADLCHINLSTKERRNLASKIALRIPFESILDEVRNSACNEKEIRRLHLITRQDLRNIEKCFNLTSFRGIRHKNDATSVDSWARESEAVLFYKPQGTLNKDFPELRNDDFILIIMNESQKVVLEKYGKDCVCLDSTHSVNQYAFELTTLLVLDELHQGFPCSFMISNKTNETFMSIFFKCIKSNVSVQKPKTFMSDMAESFYNAWKAEMGPVNFRLFCAWHVDQAWRKQIKKIPVSFEIKKDIYKKLIILMQETDENTFLKMVENFLILLKCDNQLAEFAKYFEANYVKNIKCWAYCYRMHSGLNTNMHLERMHRTLKYIYLRGKKNKRIDTCIFSLMNFIRDKVFDRFISLNIGKVTTKISISRKRHKESLKIADNDIFYFERDNKWSVKSTNNPNSFYDIIPGNQNCDCRLECSDCRICIHKYLCSCIDSSIKWNICKHVHALARYINSKNCQESVTETENNNLEIVCSEKLIESEMLLTSLNELQHSQILTSTSRSSQNEEFQEAKKKYLLDLTQYIEQNINTPEELSLVKKITQPIKPTIEAFQQQPVLLPKPTNEPANKIIIPQRLYKTKKKSYLGWEVFKLTPCIYYCINNTLFLSLLEYEDKYAKKKRRHILTLTARLSADL
ncbi:hypothetical protein NQ315_002756 [Exocentrus adspersus]|uniref:SWIM-type domain-containing protein n=1 Tax=Exocentrus adspersus TaxID=1586481 RepID=A0AAV8VJV8_9CUCU|nr:hypothetical protein NQ315_002756 [Exocentrus adspersus]